jgi:hypothetical protein
VELSHTHVRLRGDNGRIYDIHGSQGHPCGPTIQLDPLMVTEGHAQLGRINGWVTGSVRPNGQLHMMNSQGVIVTGQFQGDQFRGTAWKPLVSPCIYRVEMNRVS